MDIRAGTIVADAGAAWPLPADPAATPSLPERQCPQLWLHPTALQPLAAPWPGAVLGLLSAREQQWSQALPAAQAWRYRRSRGLLRCWLAQRWGCTPQQVPLHSPPGAPPRLEDGAGCLSLSHSGAALLLAWSPQPIGVDLEWLERPLAARALLERFFPAAERQQLQGWPAQALRRAVLRSWVHKEAAIKARHGTLAQELAHWCFDHRGGRVRHHKDAQPLESAEGVVDGWQWAAAGQGCAQARLWVAGVEAADCGRTGRG